MTYEIIKQLLDKYDKQDIILRGNAAIYHHNKDIHEIRVNKNQDFTFVEVFFNFLCLQSSFSSLPSHIFDKILSNDDKKNGWSLLFDFFNNQILWLFFDVLKNQNYINDFNENFSDNTSQALLSLLSLNKEQAKDYFAFAPYLLNIRKTKQSIENILSLMFGLQNQLYIIENIPQVISLSKEEQAILGKQNTILGDNFLLGGKIISSQHKIAIVIDNLDYDKAIDFFYGKSLFVKLKNVVSYLTNYEFCVDLHLNIKYSNKMPLVLGNESCSKLGFGSMLSDKYHHGYSVVLKLIE